MNRSRNLLGLALAAIVAIPAAGADYVTKNASGTTSCEVHFPADPQAQIRLVGAIATSDKAASVLSIRTGTTPYVIGSSNASGGTISVTTTNGLAADDVLVIVNADGTHTSAVIAAFLNTTNITLVATNGVVTLPGDEVYKMSAATTLKCAAATVNYQGEAIYSGNRGRPVRVVLDGTSACSLDAITVRYD